MTILILHIEASKMFKSKDKCNTVHKINKRRISRTLSFVLMISCIYFYACYVFMPKTNDSSYWYSSRGFRGEEKNSIDVLCLGSSGISCAVIPSVLYGQYGISCSNASTFKTTMNNELGLYKESLDYQKPKVVILDTEIVWNGMTRTYKESPGAFYLTPFWNHSKIFTLKPNDLYLHTITNEDLFYNHLGCYTYLNSVASFDSWGINSDTQLLYTISSDKDAEIKEFISTILSNNVSILLLTTPEQYSRKYDSFHLCYHPYFVQLAKQYKNVSYLDFNDTETNNTGIDANTDFYKIHHLNVTGAQKASAFLGEYLKSRYDLTDYRTVKSKNFKLESSLAYFNNLIGKK